MPSVSQCPIAPGKSLTYQFIADLYGTSWYHSHYSAQYAGGIIGPMIIYGPKSADYDIDLGPVLLTDYYHESYYDIVEEVMGTDLTKVAPKSVNNLINGKMDYNCSLVTDGTPCTNNAGLAKFQFTTGKKHRLRLINAGSEGIQKFSIDGHTLTIIANDFVPINPYDTEIVTLGVSQTTPIYRLGHVLTCNADRPAYRRDRHGDRHRKFHLLDALHHLQLLPHNPTRRPSNHLLSLRPHHYQTHHHRLARHHRPMRQRPLSLHHTRLLHNPNHRPHHNHHPDNRRPRQQHRPLPLDRQRRLLPRRLQRPLAPPRKRRQHLLPL